MNLAVSAIGEVSFDHGNRSAHHAGERQTGFVACADVKRVEHANLLVSWTAKSHGATVVQRVAIDNG